MKFQINIINKYFLLFIFFNYKKNIFRFFFELKIKNFMIIFYKKQNLFYRFEKYTKDLIKKNINILNK